MTGDLPPFQLQLRGVTCTRAGSSVRDVNVSFSPRSLNVLAGGASSAKDALIRVLGLIEKPDSGDVAFGPVLGASLDEVARVEFRRRIGLLFAAPFLLPGLTVIENVAMPLFKLLDCSATDARDRAEALLAFVGMTGREQERAGDLNPAEQRLIALARALAPEPDLMLVENLDAGLESVRFASLLRNACTRWGVTVVATAGSEWQSESADHVWEIAGGTVRSRAVLVK